MVSMLKDELYYAMLESPLGACGADQTLPALEELLRDMKNEKFWQDKHTHLSGQQISKDWPSYRRDLFELRERMLQRDELLSWLVMFMIENYRELARTSAVYEPRYQLSLDKSTSWPPEHELVIRADWQAWVVNWLRDALRDESLNGFSYDNGNF